MRTIPLNFTKDTKISVSEENLFVAMARFCKAHYKRWYSPDTATFGSLFVTGYIEGTDNPEKIFQKVLRDIAGYGYSPSTKPPGPTS